MADGPPTQKQQPGETSAHREGDDAATPRDRIRGLGGAIFEPWEKVRDYVNANARWSYKVLILLVLVVAVLLPHLTDWFELPLWLQRGTSGAALARLALFTLFALGLNVVVGFAGLLDLGYVAFWAVGAYTAGIMTGAHAYTKILYAGESAPEPQWQMWMWLILLAALVIAVLAGVLLGSPTLRLRGDYLAIVTLGFGEIIRLLAENLEPLTGGPRGISGVPSPAINAGPVNLEWGTIIDVKFYYLLLFFVILWVLAIRALDNSRIGRAWVAIREDEVAAASMGVPVVRMKLAAFAIGACTAGVGGVIYAQQFGSLEPPTFNIVQSILILAMVVIGGMGSIPGTILGTAVVVLLPEIFRGFADYRFFFFGFVLVVVMIFRPQGIWPSRRRKAELLGGTHDQSLYEARA